MLPLSPEERQPTLKFGNVFAPALDKSAKGVFNRCQLVTNDTGWSMFLKSKFTAVLLAGSVSLAALAGVALPGVSLAAPLTYSEMIKLDRINSFKLDPTGRYAVLSIR